MVDFSCVFAALLFTSANVLKILFFVTEQERKRPFFDAIEYSALDVSYLEEEWAFRLGRKNIFLASGFINAMAWSFFMFPCLKMAWLLSNQGTKAMGVNIGIALFAFGGACTEWLSHFFWLGINVMAKLMVEDFNLGDFLRDDMQVDSSANDGFGFKILELGYVSSSGLVWFVDAFEWFCLAGVFILTFISVRRWRKEDKSSFGARWNGLSLFIGLLAVVELVTEILRFEGQELFGPIAIAYAAINRLLLMPAWIIALGCMLPRAALKQTYGDHVASELALSEMASAKPTPQFTIDDGEEDGMKESTPPLEGGERTHDGP